MGVGVCIVQPQRSGGRGGGGGCVCIVQPQRSRGRGGEGGGMCVLLLVAMATAGGLSQLSSVLRSSL